MNVMEEEENLIIFSVFDVINSSFFCQLLPLCSYLQVVSPQLRNDPLSSMPTTNYLALIDDRCIYSTLFVLPALPGLPSPTPSLHHSVFFPSHLVNSGP